MGSSNFPTSVNANPPDLVQFLASQMQRYHIRPEVEAFDVSHIFEAVRLADSGLLLRPLYIQFVMGVKGGMPADKRLFDFCVETLNRLDPTALW